VRSIVKRDEWLAVRISLTLFVFFAVAMPLIRPARVIIPALLASVGLVWYFKARGLTLLECLLLVVYFLLLFDSPVTSFTALNIKVWYPILALIIVVDVLSALTEGKVRVRPKRLLLLGFFLVLSLYYFVVDNATGRVYNVKYWVFTIGLWLTLLDRSGSLFRDHRQLFTSYLLGLFLFVAAFGLLQFVALTGGLGNLYMREPWLLRPDAFFSETTWYATYCFFGLVFLFWYVRASGTYLLLIVVPVFLAGLLLSNTRNVMIPMALVAALAIVFWLAHGRLAVKWKSLRAGLLLLGAATVLGIAMLPILVKLLNLVLLKVRLEDASAVGRLLAFREAWALAMQSPLTGQGFYWDDTVVVLLSGTAIGAKAFNLLLQVFSIFGFLGAVPLLVILLGYGLRSLVRAFAPADVNARFGLYFFLGFVSISMFAPLHQFAIGMQVLAMSNLFLQRREDGG
jgi:hypothetical protein